MKKLLLFLLLLPTTSFARNGTVFVIDKIAPKNAAFIGVVDSSQAVVNTGSFSKNLTGADVDVQHALNTLDQLTTSGGGGGGSSTLAVKLNSVTVSSPTAVINFLSPFLVTLTGGATSQVALDTTTSGGLLTISSATATYFQINSTSTLAGGNNTNVQSKQNGYLYGDNGFQYDKSVSSISVTGGIGDYGQLLLDKPGISAGLGAARASLSYDPSNSAPTINLRTYDTSAISGGFIMNDSNGNNTGQVNIPPQLTGSYQIKLSSNSTVGLKTRYVIGSVDGKHTFDKQDASAMVVFDPVGNASFTIPVVLSTLTVNRQIIDSAGSAGSNGNVLTSNGSVDLWQAPSAGSSIDVSTGGFVVGASTSINFIAGTGMTITATNSSNRVNLTFNSTASGAGSSSGTAVFFNEIFGAAQSKIPGSGAPFISNSTNETSAGIYYDDTSTQSVTWSIIMKNWAGGQLSADILFTSTATSGTMNWGVYTDTEQPNIGQDNYDTPVFSAVVTTSVVMNSVSNSLQKATVVLSNTVVQSSNSVVTFKLEREAGSNDSAVGFGRVKGMRVYESTGASASGGASINAILNQNFLQSGATAYPDFLYVGTSATINGQLKVVNTIIDQNGIQLTTITFTGSGPGVMHVVANSSNVVTGLVLSTEIANTAVTPGSYTNTNLTVDQQGRITAASNGTAGGGGASTLAIGTGTASNFTTSITSPTAVVSFLGTQFRSVAGGTTNFISLNPDLTLSSLTVSTLTVTSSMTASNISVSSNITTPLITISSNATSGAITYLPNLNAISVSTSINTYGSLTSSVGTSSATFGYSSNVPGALISTNTQVNGVLTVVSGSTVASTISYGLVVFGHIEVSSTTPVISACGSSPNGSVVGNDYAGKITIGGTAPTSCTMTFAAPWNNAPACTTLSNTSITSPTGTTTTTALTLGAGVAFGGDVIMYHCSGFQ